jgi:dihydropyrimidinase/allantoinase
VNRAEIVLRNCLVYTPGGFFDGGVAISDGKITAMGGSAFLPPAGKEIDLHGAALLPGGVDTHVHVRDPGRRERGDFATESAAAAAGGITTILEMSISSPPQYTADILAHRSRCASERSSVDFGFYGAAGNRPEHIAELAERGVAAFKTFLFRPHAGREGEFEGTCAEGDGNLLEIFEAVSKTGKLCAVHAENDDLIRSFTRDVRAGGGRDLAAHGRARPPLAEVSAVAKVLAFARATGVRLGICHVSTPEAMELIRKEKAEGRPVYAETCPQYLFCDEESAALLGPFAKFNPPIRKKADAEALWNYVRNGIVDYIGSDHGPFLLSEKEPGTEDIFAAPAGSTGFEERLPLFVTAVRERKLSLRRMVDLLSANAARIFGLYPQKGTISVGSDADLVAVNLHEPFIVRASRMKTAGKGIARLYEGRRLFGVVTMTMVRGGIVFSRDGNLPPATGRGRDLFYHSSSDEDAFKGR